jgi:hypothetical protein
MTDTMKGGQQFGLGVARREVLAALRCGVTFSRRPRVLSARSFRLCGAGPGWIGEVADAILMQGERVMSLLRVLVLGVVVAAVPIVLVARADDQAIIEVLIESANTPAQHQALADYYKGKAAEAKKEAEMHRSMAKTYSGQKYVIAMAQMDHCNKLASLLDSEAAEYEQLATAHAGAAKK